MNALELLQHAVNENFDTAQAGIYAGTVENMNEWFGLDITTAPDQRVIDYANTHEDCMFLYLYVSKEYVAWRQELIGKADLILGENQEDNGWPVLCWLIED